MEKNNAAERTIVGTRILHAPRELVWKVFTEADHVVKWWGPNGFTTTIETMNVASGGEWNFTMHGPDGTDYRNEIRFDEVVPPERLVYTHGPSPKFQAVIEFIDKGGETELHWSNIFETTDDFRRAVELFHAVEGQQQTLGRLEEYLVHQVSVHA